MNADRLRIIRRLAPEIFTELGPHGGVLKAPAADVVPVALEGGVLTVFAYPTGTASMVDQRAAQLRQTLAERGAQVDVIEAIEVSRKEILLAKALVEVESRLAKLEGPS